MFSPTTFWFVSIVSVTPSSSSMSPGSSKVMNRSSSQCGHQIGKSVPPMIRSGPSQKSRLAMTLANSRAVAEEHVGNGKGRVDVQAAAGQPTEIVEPRQPAVVDDEVELRVERRRLVDVADVELLQRQRPHRGALVEVHIRDTQLDAQPVELEDHRVVGLPPARLPAPFGRCTCLLYTSPSPRDRTRSRMPSSA